MKRRLALLALAAGLLAATAACVPPNPGPSGLYLGIQPDITPVVTPRSSGIVWGAAPVIDEHYGGVLYEGTGLEKQDSRPALLAGDLQPLRLWVADPDNGVTNRPAILWFHGGGFALGIDSMHGLVNSTGKEYARRGYVSISVEYRIDTTLVGTGTRPPSLCQWVQDNVDLDDPVWLARRDQCARNINAAGQDALAAVRWVRAHAADYGIDPNRIAIGGFSAGAVISSYVAYQSDQVGDVAYFTGDDLSPEKSRARAAIGASGCLPSPDFGPPSTIGAGDSPMSMIQSELDPAVTYSCVKNTISAARSAGLVAELTSYCDQAGHASTLYEQNKAATDEQWTTFLTREMQIYSGMPAATADPFCT